MFSHTVFLYSSCQRKFTTTSKKLSLSALFCSWGIKVGVPNRSILVQWLFKDSNLINHRQRSLTLNLFPLSLSHNVLKILFTGFWNPIGPSNSDSLQEAFQCWMPATLCPKSSVFHSVSIPELLATNCLMISFPDPLQTY